MVVDVQLEFRVLLYVKLFCQTYHSLWILLSLVVSILHYLRTPGLNKPDMLTDSPQLFLFSDLLPMSHNKRSISKCARLIAQS